MKKIIGLAAACILSFNANAVPITAGSTSATQSGNEITFTFDLLSSDIRADNSLTFSAFGISFTVTQTGGVSINQDVPSNGGLGVDGSSKGDNFEFGEMLSFVFGSNVDLMSITFNGTPGSDGHSAASGGQVDYQNNSGGTSGFMANMFDGVGTEDGQQGSLANGSALFANLSSFLLSPSESNRFNGYVESITVRRVTDVPEPFTLGLLGLGLAGLAASRRRRQS